MTSPMKKALAVAAVAVLLGVVVAAFILGMNFYQKRVQNSQMEKVSKAENRMVRFNSTTLGPIGAPVTIVEFFDPACETCRDFYPIVKDLMKKYPNDVRLVLRYAPFHAGSDKVVKLLEASKRQGKYWQTLEAILAAQPSWASHGSPNLDVAYQVAAQTGLDVKKALADAQTPEIEEVQDHATQWTWSYNHDRPHMALGGITPNQRLLKAA